MGQFFGTDGVRGIANDLLTPDLALQLGLAYGQSCDQTNTHQRPTVLIAKDTRRSGDMLESSLAAGFCSVGVDVWLLGVAPTPAIAWLTRQQELSGGAVISASHNPSPDNGIKFFGPDGRKLSDQTEEMIESRLLTIPKNRPTGQAIGRIYDRHELTDLYLQHVASTVPCDLTGLRLLVDTANGAMHEVAPRLLKQLGCHVTVIGNMPDGDNINAGCGSTHLDLLKSGLKEGNFDLGIAFDGDGDRLLAVAPDGRVLDGDFIMFLATEFLPSLQDQPAIVATVMSNLGFEQALQRRGKKLLRAKVGDRYVSELMRSSGSPLGGEQSGHLIFEQYNTTGDGLLTAVQLLSALRLSQKPLSELFDLVPNVPQILVNVRVSQTTGWNQDAILQEAISAAEASLRDRGRLLVRASGTEPLIRIMIEGDDADYIHELAESLASITRERLMTP